MSLKNRSIVATIWSAAQGWGGQLIGLAVFTVLARILEPEAFGLVALAGVYLAFTTIFVEQGFGAAIVQRQDLEAAHLDTAFWTNLAFGLALTVSSFFLAEPLAALFKQEALAPIIRWLSLSILIHSLCGVQAAILMRNLQFKPLAMRTLVAGLVGGAVGIGMAFSGFGVWSLVGQQLAISCAQVIMLWTHSKWRPSLNFSISHFKQLIAYSGNVLGINILEFVNRYADNILIGYFLGPVALGYYALAYKLFQTLTQLLTGATSQVAFSSFSTLQQDTPRLRRAFYTIVGLTALIAFPTHMGTFAIAPELLRVVFGEKWESSITVLQVLCFAGILESVYYFNASVMMAMGKPSWRLKINILASVLNVIGFYIAVRWGITAVAMAYVIRAYLVSPIPLILVRKLIQIDIGEYLKNLAPPLTGSLIMVATILATKQILQDKIAPGYLPIMLYVTAGALSYTVVAFIIDRPRIIGLLDIVKSFRAR